ncbi:MAG TPA: hypothetical protein VN937_05005, partial [Blastocatellia bacterium]|nr:hypothetical protein [Blastocatellia bacterium]
LRNEIMSVRESQAILDATAQVKADSAPIELADRKRLQALLSAQRRSLQLNGPNHFLPSRSFLPVARSTNLQVGPYHVSGTSCRESANAELRQLSDNKMTVFAMI